jgi:hypothetical protein
MGAETNLMDDFTVSFFIENTSFVFILLAVASGFVAGKLLPKTAFLKEKTFGCFILILPDSRGRI